jgi:hypothetical protein
MADDTLLDDELDQAERERSYAAEDRRYRVAQARQEQSSGQSGASKTIDQALALAKKAPIPVYGRVAVGAVAFFKAHPEAVWLLGGLLMLLSAMQFFIVFGSLAFVGYILTHPFEILKQNGLAAIGWVIDLLKNFGLPFA